jgi:hypothetical protein
MNTQNDRTLFMDENAAMDAEPLRKRTRRPTSAARPEMPVPNLDEFGHREFTHESLQSLTEGLQDPRWPRGTLNIFALEGLLAALLVLPLGLRPGSWLPLVWNESGWRVPPLLRQGDRFNSFIELVMGLVRRIDQELLMNPPQFTSVLDGLGEDPQPTVNRARQDWAHGFGLALKVCDHIRIPSGSNVHRALCSIAAHSHTPVTSRQGYLAPPSIQTTVLLLAAARTSRGPLGRLLKVKVGVKAGVEAAQPNLPPP